MLDFEQASKYLQQLRKRATCSLIHQHPSILQWHLKRQESPTGLHCTDRRNCVPKKSQILIQGL